MRVSLLLCATIAGPTTSALTAQLPLPSATARAVAATIRVEGEVPRPTTMTADVVRALPHQTVRAADHGQPPATYDGVPLAVVLARAGVSMGPSLRGPRLASYVVVEAADGYRAVFALAELDSGFTSKVVLLADRVNGQPLPAAAGPFRVVVPDEKRPARWVRQVTAIRLLTAPASAAAAPPMAAPTAAPTSPRP